MTEISMKTAGLSKLLDEIKRDNGPRLATEVFIQMCNIVVMSMIADGSNYKNESEIKYRINVAAKLARELRYDLKWSIQRIMDNMPVALRDMLDNGGYSPDESRDSWIKTPEKPTDIDPLIILP